jgi:hypothetical protein
LVKTKCYFVMEMILMVGLTLSAEQIRNAPPEVRRWLEQELLASLGLQPPSTEPNAPPLVACSSEEAAKVLSLIQGMIPVVSVFFELGREGARTEIEGIEAFRLNDILRHTRLQTLEQVVACLDSIDEAVGQVRGDPEATFYGLDSRGHCFVAERTQRSIARVWQEMIATGNLPPFAPSSGDAAAPSSPIAFAPSRPVETAAPDRAAVNSGFDGGRLAERRADQAVP